MYIKTIREAFGKHSFFWLLAVEKILFDITYIGCFSPTYSYCGAILDIRWWKILLGWLATAVLLVISEKLPNNAATAVYKILLGLSALPSFSIFGLKNEPTQAFILITIYWFVFYAVLLFLNEWSPTCVEEVNSLKWLQMHRWIVTILFAWLVLSSVFFSGKYGEFRFFIRFEDVYDYRLDESTQINGLMGYVFAWNTSILMPLCLLMQLILKQYIRAMVLCVMTFMCYSIGGNKAILLYMIISISVYVVWRLKKQKYFLCIVEGSFGLVLFASNFISHFVHKGMFAALAYRLFSIPAEAHYFYYDFFQDNELLYLRQSALGRWIAAPYTKEVSVLIGSDPKYYFTGHYNNASNGLFSMDYANFGWFGVIIGPIFIALTVWALFYNIRKWDSRIKTYIVVYSCLYLLSASYTSWLLTGGVFLLVVMASTKWIFKIVQKKLLNKGVK